MHNTLKEYLQATYPLTEAQKIALRAAKFNLYEGPAAPAAEGLPGWGQALATLREYVDNLPGDVYEDRDCGHFQDDEPHQMQLNAGDWVQHDTRSVIAAALGCKYLSEYL